tara:strand:- start:634 stop:1002 length:369 start_codon:yes stop_codon:yes gene_type:complete
MIKSAIALAAAAPLLAAPALAAPYINVESNTGFTGSDYGSTTLEGHIGFDGTTESGISWYVQGGPAFITEDGEDTESALTGKAGGAIPLSERLSVYGETSFAAVDGADDTNYGVKLGGTFSF